MDEHSVFLNNEKDHETTCDGTIAVPCCSGCSVVTRHIQKVVCNLNSHLLNTNGNNNECLFVEGTHVVFLMLLSKQQHIMALVLGKHLKAVV